MPMLTTPEEALVLILLFMLVEIDRRETAAALEQQQQQQNGQTSSSRKSKKSRRWWVRPWLTEQEREKKGQYHQLLKRELSVTDQQSFVNYLRMPVDLFNEIVDKVAPLIQTQKTNWRDPLPPALKVAITLRHLATGDSYPSLSFNFRCGKTSITRVIPQVCRAIVNCYREETFKLPVCPDDWKRLAAEFEERSSPTCCRCHGRQAYRHKEAQRKRQLVS